MSGRFERQLRIASTTFATQSLTVAIQPDPVEALEEIELPTPETPVDVTAELVAPEDAATFVVVLLTGKTILKTSSKSC
jgi:hypothetical protein